VLSVDAVKTHMRALFDRFELRDVAQSHKRLRLAERAFESGALSGWGDQPGRDGG
jgi:hypothetical protein